MKSLQEAFDGLTNVPPCGTQHEGRRRLVQAREHREQRGHLRGYGGRVRGGGDSPRGGNFPKESEKPLDSVPNRVDDDLLLGLFLGAPLGLQDGLHAFTP